MYKPYQSYSLDWQGLHIEVRYCPSWSKSYEDIYGAPLAHLAIETVEPPRSPLPMTETGFRSHFTVAEAIDNEGGAVAFVRGWLEEGASSADWKKQEAAARQLSFL